VDGGAGVVAGVDLQALDVAQEWRMNERPYEVAILAGGAGTRLRARTGDLPKPMVPVRGKPLLQHQVELCRRFGFNDILLLLHHRPEAVLQHFGDGGAFGVRIGHAVETTPRGTAGALRDALPLLAPHFLVLYGDTFVDVELRRVLEAHHRTGADATLLLHPNDHPHDSDLVVLDRDGHVRELLPYPHPPHRSARNLVNAALYAMRREGLERFAPIEGQADIAKHMFPAMLAAGRPVGGYVTPEYIKDAGTPERLDKIERDIDTGVVERLSARAPRLAVFLDRDGTINEEVGHLRRPDQLALVGDAAAAIRRLNRSGHLAVVVTNQPVLARGEVNEDQLDAIHAQLDTLLGMQGAYLDATYVCPHHPDKGFAGEVAALKTICDCRKPGIALIERACRDLGIGIERSWFVGDSTSDIEAGRRAGLRTILVQTGHGGSDGKFAHARPDHTVHDLAAAVELILANDDGGAR
jgi:histidinol-phosphate phosphatase family protein